MQQRNGMYQCSYAVGVLSSGHKSSVYSSLAPTGQSSGTAESRSKALTCNPAFLQFGRKLRTTDDINHDIRSVIQNDNFVAEITPYLKKFAALMKQIKEREESKQDFRKQYAEKRRTSGYRFIIDDRVWVNKHPLSSSVRQRTSKFMPRQDGPYVILSQRSPTTFEVVNLEDPDVPIVTSSRSIV
ncbi:uncharacterized protein TNCV_4469641 [Trichonephila clavipes]|nr:uncharacterized protein TNCV_4469641 [Trichonephila clavipes]